MSPWTSRLLRVVPLALLGVAGCMRTPTAVDLRARPAASRSRIVVEAMRLIQERYVAPERIDPPMMLRQAVAELAKVVPGAKVLEEGGGQIVRLEGQQVVVRPEAATDLDALGGLLDALIAWVGDLRSDVPTVKVQAAALRGAVHPLDRWCTVVAGPEQAQLLENFRGTTAGIGVQIGRRDGALIVVEVYPGTPAAEAGIQRDDRFVSVDGQPVSDRPVGDVTRWLKGTPGSEVRVELSRQGRSQPLSLVLTRREFVAPTVSTSMAARGILHLQVRHLAQNSGVFASRALIGVQDLSGLRGIILDLRGNSGGSMVAAGQIADQFVDHGVLIETRGKDDRPVPGLLARIDAKTKTGSNVLRKTPLVVLMDHGTGSSSEVLVAALAWHDRALLVGERTFGKNVMQQLLRLDKDTTLKLTVARSYAAGRPLPAEGIDPDVEILPDKAGSSSPRCLKADVGQDVAVAAFPTPAGSTDPARALAVTLLERYRADSRSAGRNAIAREVCTGDRGQK